MKTPSPSSLRVVPKVYHRRVEVPATLYLDVPVDRPDPSEQEVRAALNRMLNATLNQRRGWNVPALGGIVRVVRTQAEDGGWVFRLENATDLGAA
jgi:hypothetical protein